MEYVSTGTVTWIGRAIPVSRASGTLHAGGKALAEALNVDWSGAYRRTKELALGRKQFVMDARGALQLTVMIPFPALHEVFGDAALVFLKEAGHLFSLGDEPMRLIVEQMGAKIETTYGIVADIMPLIRDAVEKIDRLRESTAMVSQEVSEIRATPAESTKSLWSVSDYLVFRGIPAADQQTSYSLGREASKFSRAANLPMGEEQIGQGKRRTYAAAAIRSAYQTVFGVDLEEDATQ